MPLAVKRARADLSIDENMVRPAYISSAPARLSGHNCTQGIATAMPRVLHAPCNTSHGRCLLMVLLCDEIHACRVSQVRAATHCDQFILDLAIDMHQQCKPDIDQNVVLKVMRTVRGSTG
jgi:hypothetical protein